MSTQSLDGSKLREMLIGGAENIRQNLSEINDLNVFPVPDGDTGTNMTMTIDGGLAELGGASSSLSSVMDRFAHGMLLGARGNSGVILSQIFAGIKEVLSRYESVTAVDLAEAYKSGIEKSYASVVNPTEGTILTVFRESTEYASERIDSTSTIEDFYRLHIEEARRSLERTKEILPVLAEADVVDSGGAGYLCIAIGMYSALTGEFSEELYKVSEPMPAAPRLDLDSFRRDSVLEFGYCTEFLLRLTCDKTPDFESFDPAIIISTLEELGGESIVCYKTDDIVKVHVHTFEPGAVLNACQRYGEFLTLKIENMSVGHTEAEAKPKKVNELNKPYSVIAVATGEGLSSLFLDMGADGIIKGGQTANPSTEEFLEAFDAYHAEDIIVLPNNKNILLAAKQAQEMYKDARIHIVPTKTIMQGYAALSVINPGVSDIDTIVESAARAAAESVGGEITCAVRDVSIDGVDIKKGDYIAISEGSITAVADTSEQALLKMLASVADLDEREIVTLFVGLDVDDERRAEITERLEELYPELEIIVYKGGQELYDFLVTVE